MLKAAGLLLLAAASPVSAAELAPSSCAPLNYAPEALRYEMEGVVQLQFKLDKDGIPVAPSLLQTSGYALLDRNALAHIQACKFTPPASSADQLHTSTVTWRLPEGRAEQVARFLPQSCARHYKVFTAPDERDYLTIRTQVWADGRPYTAKVEHSSGDAEVDALAVRYLENCRFDPAQRKGAPTHGAVMLTLPLDRLAFGENKIHEVYDKLATNTAQQKDYKVAHILYAGEEAARDAITQLRAGTSFSTLARQYSLDKASGKVDGELGWVRASDMVAPFAAALKAQASTGLIDTPVHTAFGWHVVQIEETRPMRMPAYEALRDRIRTQLINAIDTPAAPQ